MKVLSAGLSAQTPVTSYDKTKPSLAGRVFSKTIGGATVYGPPLTGFINTQSDTGATPSASRTTPNGRMFQLLTITTGVATIALYNIDQTGQSAPAYVGRIFVLIPNAAATTHTLRGFEVYDGTSNATVTGWQIYLGTTGSVAINGGLFIVNNVALADFSPLSPPTIGMALSSGAKAVYMVQDPGTIGVANTLTAMQGLALDRATRRLYFHNNVLATTQFAVFDPSVSPTVNLQTTTSPTVSGTATFTLTGHGYAANDPVVITSNAPTAFTASVANAAPTVYFVRNPTANTFELSATTGGASILATSNTSSTVVTRAFGQSTAQWLSIRTGTVTGFAGTILLTNCEAIVTPSQTLDPNIPAAVNGQTCLFFGTNSNVYLIKVSEITNGATTFPTMVGVATTGSGSDYTAITPTYTLYDDTAGRVIIVSNTSQFYVKRWLPTTIDLAFGGLNTTYFENSANVPYTFAGVTIANLEFRLGWAYLVTGTIGQRGVLYVDFRSDSSFGYSYITSPVLDTSLIATAKTIQTIEKLFDLTGSMVFSYKTAALSTDAAFNSPTTGWTVIATANDLALTAFNNFSQFRIDFAILNGCVNTPSQINELFLSYLAKGESSDNWAMDNDNTTQGTGSPSYAAFYLQSAYTTSVPTIYARVYDTSNNLIFSANSSANPTAFQYSTNGGTSWLALGTIPNTVGTRVRVLVTPTPSGVAYASVRES
jgi:hypothetical protein